MSSSPNHDDLSHLKIHLEDILSATNNFDEENLIGEDASEKVYLGQLLWSSELINIFAGKLNKEWDGEKEQEFWMEVSMLSSLKHKNLVSFVGFCDENEERIIIIHKFEFTGTLRDYLSDPLLFTWVRRLEICVGVAHALSYIHYDESPNFSVIHHNINSSSILLRDDKWEAKLCDFTRSMKIKASERHQSFSTDKVWGTNRYTDPAYIETNIVNHKSDMYSFGIVMFELLCGTKAVMDDNQNNKYLASVSLPILAKKNSMKIIDWEI
ncbi:kinase-like domain-containing protein [Tanacetum coccineum]